MFNSSSPLYIKPRLDLDFLQWVWAFNKSCTQKNVNNAIPVIKDISVFSQELYDDIKNSEDFNFHYKKNGLFMFCQTEKALENEIKIAHLAKQEGLNVREIDLNELKVLEPNVEVNVRGATFYECDSHITPGEFMQEMKAYVE